MSTSPPDWSRIRAVFESAVAVAPAERRSHVEAACGEDSELRTEVEALLTAHEQADGFLTTAAAWATMADAALNLEACRLGPYELVTRLASSDMGDVYRARDTRLDRTVAVKVLPTHWAADPLAADRFAAEARAIAALNHPHICMLYDVGEAPSADDPAQAPLRFLVMEHVDGQTLAQLTDIPLEPMRAMRIGSQASSALGAAHARGIVHRDIKPSNLMLTASEQVKVLDFGIATLDRDQGTMPERASADTAVVVAGTVPFMSPEQARGDAVTSATDIFSLGIVLYWLLTGRHPFAADRGARMVAPLLGRAPVSPHWLNPAVPPALSALIIEALDQDPSRRPDAGTLERALNALIATTDSSRARSGSRSRRQHVVGRQSDRERLEGAFAEAANGHPLLVTVSGEPGIGKTTFVEAFLGDLEAQGRARVARGRCSERLAGSEAFLPILEALEELLAQGDEYGDTERQMRTIAPSWYAEVVRVEDLDERAIDQPAFRSASQERMKREMRALLTAMSRTTPLVLFLDDVQWSDVSTVELLGYLCRRLGSMRVLVLVAYRTTELLLSNHPFASLELELSAHKLCVELPLTFLTRTDAARFLDLEFPGHRFPSQLAEAIHDRTEGSPLFMTDVVRDLRDRHVVAPTPAGWELQQSIASIARDLPRSVRSMIERKIAQLSNDDRSLLVVASVQGHEFDSTVVAAALGLSAAEVEERLDLLDRVHAFVGVVGESLLPDGTPTVRFRFVHVLYQNALSGSLLPTRRATLSGTVADVLIKFHGSDNVAMATEVAVLLEAARDHWRAVHYFLLATQNALRVFAFSEASALAERGLRLIPALPPSPHRNEQELKLQIALGTAAVAIKGYTSPEVERAYGRARELCLQAGDSAELASVLFGLFVYYLVVPDHRTSLELSAQLMALSEREDRPALRLQAWLMQGMTRFWMGSIVQATPPLEQGIALYDAHRETTSTAAPLFNHGVGCRRYHSVTLWMQGRPQQAVARMTEALDAARELKHPLTLASTLSFAGMLHYFRRDAAAALRAAAEAVDCTREFALTFWLGFARAVQGWAHAQLAHGAGDAVGWADGLSEVRNSLEVLRGAGARTFCSVHAALLAETYMLVDDHLDDAARAIDEGLALAAQVEEGIWVAELHRLHGELAQRSGDHDGAAVHFRRAVGWASERQHRALQLRALNSLVLLARTHPGVASPDHAAHDLAAACAPFDEEADSPELRHARLLLASG